MTRPRLSLERTWDALLSEVWALWTTPDGIESWWGPDGFTVAVRSQDLRPGGLLRYTMTATAAPMIAFMEQHGMPLATEATITYTEVTPVRRLAYVHLVDFVPGLESYDVATVVELHGEDGDVRMVLSFDPMHDDTWTERQRAGWESELGKLAAVLARRAGRAS
jgi:uncharacterized protein YndB with AHSA1/START domain